MNIELYKFTINAIEAKRKASKGEVTTLEFARMAQLRPDIWCDIRAFRKVATTKELKNIKKRCGEVGMIMILQLLSALLVFLSSVEMFFGKYEPAIFGILLAIWIKLVLNDRT
ncbi:hypothetical protein [Desulfotomaculum copahuensis]|uniref:Uncharacterized protein n=1 Tax=Desulfotomaculum copahuensis TaxID=1838280 RepID=A0A1B7LD97_9FIRM|nr:hypothetical protein [Desulfotomaculum copahuensis]OAT81083.1 hypothetical protein A6M21_11755 [Desulfotomaculum copahuensis]